jgi:hypothetical protein
VLAHARQVVDDLRAAGRVTGELTLTSDASLDEVRVDATLAVADA